MKEFDSSIMEKSALYIHSFSVFWPNFGLNEPKQMFATDIAPSNSHQNISFKILTYTVFYVLFSHAHGFGNKHNWSNIFAIAKYCNVLHDALRSGMHLIYVHNLPDMI
jgi:hypothetical protein